MYSFFSLLSAASFLLIAGLFSFVLYRNPHSAVNRSFALGMLSFMVIEGGNFLVLFSGPEHLLFVYGIRISSAGKAILPFCWLPFSLVFARRGYKQILSKWSVPILISAFISVFFFLFFFFSPSSFSYIYNNIFFRISSLEYFLYIYIIIGLIVNLAHLENTFRSSKDEERKKIKYIIVGISSAFLFYIYFASLFLLFYSVNIEIIPINSAVLLFSSVLVGFHIIRYRLMDADIFVSRYVVYRSATLIFVGVYILLISLVVEGITFFNIPFQYFIISLFAFISLVLLSIILLNDSYNRKFKLFITRHFYKHKYEFRDKWMETIEKVSPARSVEDTIKIYIELVSETMGVDRVYLWLFDKSHNCYILMNQLKQVAERYKRVPSDHPVVLCSSYFAKPFLVDYMMTDNYVKDDMAKSVKEFGMATCTALCSPLLSGNEVVGFSMQGTDPSGGGYVKDDFELLNAITTQVAIQIKKIRLSHDLIEAKEIESFHKLSSFIMHDLKNYTNSLSLISQNAKDNMQNPEFQRDALKTINSTVSKMKKLIYKLSSVPVRVEVKKGRLQLKKFIDGVISKTSLYKDSSVSYLNNVSPSISIFADPFLMERVFVNIINNACEASKNGGNIEISSDSYDGYTVICFSDNGIGMTQGYMDKHLFRPFSTTKDKGFGIGLYQCKSIVEAHGGIIEAKSAPGRGTTFIVKIPILAAD